MGNIFDIVLVQPIVNILLFFHQLFLSINLPFAFGFSIIALTAIVRLLLHPFFHKQMQMTSKMADLKPHMDRLNKEHGKDKKKLQEEQLKLYKEMGVNPASGCLLAIVQMPIFIALYQVLTKFTSAEKGVAHIAEEINKFAYAPFLRIQNIDPNFFGINLWVMPSQFQKHGYIYLLVPLITAVLQYYQIALSTPPQPPGLAVAKKDEKDGKRDTSEDMQRAMTTQMKYIFPLMIGYFSFTLPVGLSLYWDVFSLFSIVQYMQHNKKKLKMTTK